ncbi:nucleoside deaminase [Luteimicrobium sp. DT211]|uniref:nucleoside deaminase n=1 Tax=Luteimicrobium sp. DT211 TaxID=3393412 RepID=UPI003CEB4C35
MQEPAPAAGTAPAGVREWPADDEAWLARTVELAVANVTAGGGPFGAVVVRAGLLVAEGANSVTRDNDPTAHAEVNAVRAAGRALGTFDLGGTTLYSSCEPCPLCLSAALWARVDRVVFAADRNDAALAGFDDDEFYARWATDRATWPSPRVASQRIATATLPFERWSVHAARVEY